MFTLDHTPQRPLKVWLRGLQLGCASYRKLVVLTTVLGFLILLPTLYTAMKFGNEKVTPQAVLHMALHGPFALIAVLLQLTVLVLSSPFYVMIISRLDGVVHAMQDSHKLNFILHKSATIILAYLLVFATFFIGMILAAIFSSILGAVSSAIFGRLAAVVVIRIFVYAVLIYIGIYVLFFLFAIVLDHKGPVNSLNFSCALVFRNWWRTFLVLLLTALVFMAMAVMIMVPLMAVISIHHWLPTLTGPHTGRTLLVSGVFRLAGVAVLGPFMTGIIYSLYHDLKLRRALKPKPTSMIQA